MVKNNRTKNEKSEATELDKLAASYNRCRIGGNLQIFHSMDFVSLENISLTNFGTLMKFTCYVVSFLMLGPTGVTGKFFGGGGRGG